MNETLNQKLLEKERQGKPGVLMLKNGGEVLFQKILKVTYSLNKDTVDSVTILPKKNQDVTGIVDVR